jgi:UDP-2-acetamido-2,6-beta-L-arabino-hexul-4-ose reductase
MRTMKIVVTGAGGLIGWHAAVRLHAANCAAQFNGSAPVFELCALDHPGFDDDAELRASLKDADAVLHFAGVNRAPDAVVEKSNPAIARRLVDACKAVGVRPHVVYANSTHAAGDTPYGRSKRIAGEILGEIGGRYNDLVLPHIFGEGARPRYNNVTATFIEAVLSGQTPQIDPNGLVRLLHAGVAAQAAIDAVVTGGGGVIRPEGREVSVPELFSMLQKFHADYVANIFPVLVDPFIAALFNSYRAALYPDGFPYTLKLNNDERGTLFEAVKGGGGGQTFLSTTKPGITRGNHFHLAKVERFLVVQGEALIRIRKVLSGEIWEYRVSGDRPVAVDMPTLHTHSIQNVGQRPLLTLFWTNDLFDPKAPDTYFDPVVED